VRVYLVRDVLDEQLVDRKGRRMGKVDGVVLELREAQPPRVSALEVGGMALLRRLPLGAGRWIAPLARRWGLRRGEPYRIPWSRIRDVGIDVTVDVDAPATPAYVWERWLRRHVIGRIPGA